MRASSNAQRRMQQRGGKRPRLRPGPATNSDPSITKDEVQLTSGIRGAPKIVWKYADAGLLATSITATGTVSALVNIPQGTAQSDRISDVVYLRRLILNLQVTAANSDVYSHSRVIFFQWRPNVGLIAPTVTDVLSTPSTNSYLSLINYDFRRNFTILWDKTFSCAGTATVPTNVSDHVITNEVIDIHLPWLEYTAGSSSASANTIYVLFISDSAAPPYPIIQFSTRLFYSDV
jgi:hypothetical protein